MPGAALVALAFVAIGRRTRDPLLPGRLLRLRTVAGGNTITTIVASVAVAEFFVLTLYLQNAKPASRPVCSTPAVR